MRRTSSLRFSPVLPLFFFSGAAGLLYQVVWTRHFVLVFGATVLAVSTVLAAFMGGLALGGLVGGRIASRLGNPLRAYGSLEIGLALYAGLVPHLLKVVNPLYASLYASLEDSFGALSAIRFAVSAVILLPPTVAMGATLPLLTAHAERAGTGRDGGDRAAPRRRVAWLYAINTFGAVAGTAAASFVLLPGLGLARTLLAGVTVNVLVGTVAVVLARGHTLTGGATGEPVRPPATEERVPRRLLLLAAGVLGLSALALEVLWTRTLALALGTTTYAFAIVLTVFLLGIAGGSAIASRILRRPRAAAALFVAAPGTIGLLALATLPVFDRLPDLFVRLTTGGSGTWTEGLLVRFVLAALPMLAPTLVSGAAFPLAVGIDRSAAGASRSVGDVYASNTFGAILGSWGAGFVLIPRLGLREGIQIAAALQIAMTCLLLLGWKGSRRFAPRAVAGTLVAAGLGLVLLLPDWNRTALTRGGFALGIDLRRYGQSGLSADRTEIVFLEEGITSTITVRKWGNELTMQMNGVTEASNKGDLDTQVLVGGLPGILHENPKDVLVIGLGSGITAAAAARHPGVESVECVEISEAVCRAARLFAEANHGILDDPRFHLIVGDGRNHLALSGRTFDVIVSQPSNVWVSGTGSLMASEFYRLCREHLRPGGLLSSWIQGYSLSPEALRSVLAAASRHFPRVSLWSAGWGDLVIVAGDESFSVDFERVRSKSRDPAIRQLLLDSDIPDLLGLASKNLLAGEFLARYTGDAAPNTDDNLYLEFQAPKMLYRDTIRELFESLHRAAGGTEDLATNAPEGLLAEIPRVRKARELESRGRLEFRESRGREGLRHLEEAHRLHPTDPAIAEILARALNGRGVSLARRNEPESALRDYERAAVLDPVYGEPFANAARIYLDAGGVEAAEDFVSQALLREPRQADFLALRARVRIRARKLEAARRDARESLAVDPNLLEGFVVLGDALEESGEIARAESVYVAGLERHPDSEKLEIRLRKVQGLREASP